ncbi:MULTISPECIES: inositol monophosphatase family protein [Protofrankia]|uniref:Inositol monophosphatase n=1 Tax=Candidatus Protofrankia datiscae TaxID=2716812 RepID=F8B355_9ACTN|nr:MULTISPECIES: inositol monophosphatase family protein [Protofrankia]AEH09968.1 inositol monophosphatase [Candidatus Protofrankia datiscae]
MDDHGWQGWREYLLGLARLVRGEITAGRALTENRGVRGHSPGGDAQFGIDDVAERAVWKYVVERDLPMAVFSEDRGLREHGRAPRHLLVVDPIDGTRSAVAGLESATVAVAVARLTARPRIADVRHALLMEWKTGACLYAERDTPGVVAHGYDHPVPAPTRTTDPSRMFWSLEFNGHPARLMTEAYGHLIDLSANTGGVFVFSSATYSISRLITGQLDAYVDIGNRLLRDDPALLGEFQRVGNGRVLHLFPYDIAAAVLLAEKAGIVITDAYGQPLGDTALTDLDVTNQRSCVAASTPQLHRKLLDSIAWPVRKEPA